MNYHLEFQLKHLLRNWAFRLLNLLVLALGSTCTAQTSVSGTITQLSTGSVTDQQNAPVISGTNIVWTDTVPSGTTINYDLFLLNLASGTPAVNLTSTPSDYLEDIDGGNIVWTHHASATSPGDIVLYNIATGTATTIAVSNSSAYFQEPSIRGHYVAFLTISNNIDLALYDTILGTTTDITNDAAVQAHPRVGTDMVVYEDYSTGHGQVYGYKISTNGPPAPLAPLAAGTAADQLTPDIDGNTVVWVEHQAGSDQIFALDLVTNVVTQLTTSPSNKVQPRISGNRVVWADDRTGNLDLYMYDLSTHLGEQPLVTGPGDQFLADIDGDRVVYTDNSAGFEQVFEFVFAHGPSPYNFTGFFQPVDNLPTINAVKAGSAVPVKFSLGGNQGLDIFAAGYPASQQIVCSTSAPTDQIEQTVTAGSSGLSYDATTDQYSYVWKTDKSWVGTCGQLTLMLKDGTSHTANFEFTK